MDFGGVDTASVLVVAVLIAIVAFFYSNLGLGGGGLYVPIMDALLVSLYMVDIVPLSLMFAFATMITAAITHSRKKLVDFRLGTLLASAGLVGVAAGVAFTRTVDERLVKAGFAALFVLVATKMLYDIYKSKNENLLSPTSFSFRLKLAGMGISILTGFAIGSFGIGGGVVSVPLIIYVFRLEARKAIGTSAFMGAILTPAAFMAYIFTAETGASMHFDIALVLTPVVFFFAFIGSTWGLKRLRTRIVKTIFTGGVYLGAIEMVLSLLLT
ncbi:MAG: sulfite exporter TauE/SafE family protein [Candidatus Thermoplasmatota archaeon]|nr:sulfite exporter TauE/SafE family protein [Candidatus Thermoplasmatota archaeon]